MRATKKVTLAVAMVVALLIGLATPAAAAVREVTVNGGTLSTAIGSFDLTPGSQGETPCPEEEDDPTPPIDPGKSDVMVRTDGDTAGGTGSWEIDGSFWGQFQLPAGSGTWWQADFEILPGSGGTHSGYDAGTQTTAFSGIVAIQVTISYIGEAPGPYDCSKEQVACVITGVFAVEGHIDGPPDLTESPDPHAGPPNPHSILFSGATVDNLVAAPCSGPFVAVNDTPATLTNVGLLFV